MAAPDGHQQQSKRWCSHTACDLQIEHEPHASTSRIPTMDIYPVVSPANRGNRYHPSAPPGLSLLSQPFNITCRNFEIPSDVKTSHLGWHPPVAILAATRIRAV
ncbi:hypothetical protein EMPS_08469 [Entomortierella parvispora]|uniref:Uncharacterized protein n=1 Tax=Entomortierella parvispora TaxID=205924 RepID=A0A9P3HG26_9FUNG|nr:hypothetical protein EMPS_08469 [Entomortierella parvispora]